MLIQALFYARCHSQPLLQTSIMRAISLVSLALALAASSLPLSPGADGGVSTTKGESTGTPGAIGSGLGNAVNPPGSNTASAGGLENGSIGSSAASGSENGGGPYKSGSGAASGSESGSINPARRSTTSSISRDVGDVGDIGNLVDGAVLADVDVVVSDVLDLELR